MLPYLRDFTIDVPTGETTPISQYFENGKAKIGKRGFFTEIQKCEVKEVLNGEYTLSMIINVTDKLAKEVKPDMCILAKPNFDDRPQIFVIRNINYNGSTIEISADHIKYMFFNNIVMPESSRLEPYYLEGTPNAVVNRLLDDTDGYMVLPNIFTFTSDYLGNIRVDVGSNNLTMGEIFDNSENGILVQNNVQEYGLCELKYDNFDISLLTFRGSQTAKNVVRYGTNISSYNQTMSNENEYTHLLPYADVATKESYTGDLRTIRVYGLINNTDPITTGSDSNFRRVLPIDFSSDFKDKRGYIDPSNQSTVGPDTEAVRDRLRNLGLNYPDKKNGVITSPNVSIKVDYENTLQDFEKLSLGDYVDVIYEPMGYHKKHRITETIFDPVENRYVSITIGERKYSLYDYIG